MRRTADLDLGFTAPYDGSLEWRTWMIIAHHGVLPQIDSSAYIQQSAHIIGDVHIGPESSVWFNVVVRGDVCYIRIGARVNIQDNATVHVFSGGVPTILGDGVSIAHNVVVHACTIRDFTLVGMGAIVLDGTEIGEECLIGAGAVVAPRSQVPPRSLVLGSPAKVVRPLTSAEVERLHRSAENYVRFAREYVEQGIR
jgi:carbonic anhydrase/acetyltransferase-like protein (isoleucine patch superfamily)